MDLSSPHTHPHTHTHTHTSSHPPPLSYPQGIAIFVFYVLRNDMMLPLWRRCCPHCMKTDSSSSPSTKKAVWELSIRLLNLFLSEQRLHHTVRMCICTVQQLQIHTVCSMHSLYVCTIDEHARQEGLYIL